MPVRKEGCCGPCGQWMGLVWHQFKALIFKASIIGIRKWPTTLFRVVAPSLLFLAAWILVYNIDDGADPHPNEGPSLSSVPLCVPSAEVFTGDSDHCVTLSYAYTKDNVTRDCAISVMKTLASINEPPLSFGDNGDITYLNVTTPEDMLSVFFNNQNFTTGGVFFDTCTIESSRLTKQHRPAMDYTIIYNSTTSVAYNMIGSKTEAENTNIRLNIEAALEQTVAQLLSNSSKAFITPHLRPVPVIGNSQNYSLSNQFSLLLMLTGASLGIFFSFLRMVNERTHGFRGYMKMAGTKDSLYWIGTLGEELWYTVVSVVLLMVCYAYPSFTIVRKTNILVFFVTFLTYGVLAVVLAAVLATMVGSSRFANAVASFAFLTVVLIGIVSCIADCYIYNLYQYQASISLALFPPYLLMKVLMDIKMYIIGPAYASCKLISPLGGESFDWNNLYSAVTVEGITVPNTSFTLLLMLVEIAIAIPVILYFDLIMPAAYMARRPWFYFMLRSYWSQCFSCDACKKPARGSALLSAEDLGIEVRNLSKDYPHGVFSTQADSALRLLSLGVSAPSVLCLLGHTGAGKTTTINCMVGLTPPTNGDVVVFGHSVSRNPGAIQRMAGVCPQNDILWPMLSAREHLYFYNSLKYPRDQWSRDELEGALYRVGIRGAVANQYASRLSGGMRRRLSFLLSILGDPRVIFLDEPTSGMDISSCKFIWNYIRKLRHENRLVVLATHSMEEADMLGDKLAILAEGKLRALGGPMHLKNQFGLGYRIAIKPTYGKEATVIEYVRRGIPGAELISEDGGFLVFGLPDIDATGAEAEFFNFVQMGIDRDGLPLVTDWGIRNSTLEDVFISVTRKVIGSDVSFLKNNRAGDRATEERIHHTSTVLRMQSQLAELQSENTRLRQRLLESHISPEEVLSEPVPDRIEEEEEVQESSPNDRDRSSNTSSREVSSNESSSLRRRSSSSSEKREVRHDEEEAQPISKSPESPLVQYSFQGNTPVEEKLMDIASQATHTSREGRNGTSTEESEALHGERGRDSGEEGDAEKSHMGDDVGMEVGGDYLSWTLE